jgi:hypothetical protein
MVLIVHYLLTYSTQHSPSWEANRFAATEEIPRIFMEPEISLPHSQVPATCLYTEPSQPYYFLKIYLNIILPSSPGSSNWSLHLMFLHRNIVHASPPASELHAPPISFFSILSPAQLIVSAFFFQNKTIKNCRQFVYNQFYYEFITLGRLSWSCASTLQILAN